MFIKTIALFVVLGFASVLLASEPEGFVRPNDVARFLAKGVALLKAGSVMGQESYESLRDDVIQGVEYLMRMRRGTLQEPRKYHLTSNEDLRSYLYSIIMEDFYNMDDQYQNEGIEVIKDMIDHRIDALVSLYPISINETNEDERLYFYIMVRAIAISGYLDEAIASIEKVYEERDISDFYRVPIACYITFYSSRNHLASEAEQFLDELDGIHDVDRYRKNIESLGETLEYMKSYDRELEAEPN